MASEAVAREARNARDQLIRDQTDVEQRMARAYVDAYESMLQRIERDAQSRFERYGRISFTPEEARLLDLGRELDQLGVDVSPMLQAAVDGQLVDGIQEANDLLRAGSDPTERFRFGRLNVDAVRSMAERTLEDRPVSSLLRPGVNEHRQRANEILLSHQTLGKNPREAARALRRELEVVRGGTLARWMTVARTEMMDANRNGMSALYQRHANLVQAKERMCAFDERTCMACIALDGVLYPLDAPMDDHQNGRCTWLPVLVGPYADQQRPRRAAQDWFAAQPQHVQMQMMGARNFEAWQAGQIQLVDLASHRHNAGWRSAFYQASARQSLENARARERLVLRDHIRQGWRVSQAARSATSLVHLIRQREALLSRLRGLQAAGDQAAMQRAVTELLQWQFAQSGTGTALRLAQRWFPSLETYQTTAHAAIRNTSYAAVDELYRLGVLGRPAMTDMQLAIQNAPTTPAGWAARYVELGSLNVRAVVRLGRLEMGSPEWMFELERQLFDWQQRRMPYPALGSGAQPLALGPGPTDYADWFGASAADDPLLQGMRQQLTRAQYRFEGVEYGSSGDGFRLARETWETEMAVRPKVQTAEGVINEGVLFSVNPQVPSDASSPQVTLQFQLFWHPDPALFQRINIDRWRDWYSFQLPDDFLRVSTAQNRYIRPAGLTLDPEQRARARRALADDAGIAIGGWRGQNPDRGDVPWDEIKAGLQAVFYQILDDGDVSQLEDAVRELVRDHDLDLNNPTIDAMRRRLLMALTAPDLYGFRRVGDISRAASAYTNTVDHSSQFLQPEAQALGWSSWFNARAVAYYVSHGINKVRVSTAQIGSWRWAAQGFVPQNWDPVSWVSDTDFYGLVRASGLRQDQIEGYISHILARQEQGGMTAREFAYLGHEDRWVQSDQNGIQREMWFGKYVMLEGRSWSGVLNLEPPTETSVWGVSVPVESRTDSRFPRRIDPTDTFWVSEMRADVESVLRAVLAAWLVDSEFVDTTVEQREALRLQITQTTPAELQGATGIDDLDWEVERLTAEVASELQGRSGELTLLQAVQIVLRREGADFDTASWRVFREMINRFVPTVETASTVGPSAYQSQSRAAGASPDRVAPGVFTYTAYSGLIQPQPSLMLDVDEFDPEVDTRPAELFTRLVPYDSESASDLEPSALVDFWNDYHSGNVSLVPDQIINLVHSATDQPWVYDLMDVLIDHTTYGFEPTEALNLAASEIDPDGSLPALSRLQARLEADPVWQAWAGRSGAVPEPERSRSGTVGSAIRTAVGAALQGFFTPQMAREIADSMVRQWEEAGQMNPAFFESVADDDSASTRYVFRQWTIDAFREAGQDISVEEAAEWHRTLSTEIYANLSAESAEPEPEPIPDQPELWERIEIWASTLPDPDFVIGELDSIRHELNELWGAGHTVDARLRVWQTVVRNAPELAEVDYQLLRAATEGELAQDWSWSSQLAQVTADVLERVGRDADLRDVMVDAWMEATERATSWGSIHGRIRDRLLAEVLTEDRERIREFIDRAFQPVARAWWVDEQVRQLELQRRVSAAATGPTQADLDRWVQGGMEVIEEFIDDVHDYDQFMENRHQEAINRDLMARLRDAYRTNTGYVAAVEDLLQALETDGTDVWGAARDRLIDRLQTVRSETPVSQPDVFSHLYLTSANIWEALRPEWEQRFPHGVGVGSSVDAFEEHVAEWSEYLNDLHTHDGIINFLTDVYFGRTRPLIQDEYTSWEVEAITVAFRDAVAAIDWSRYRAPTPPVPAPEPAAPEPDVEPEPADLSAPPDGALHPGLPWEDELEAARSNLNDAELEHYAALRRGFISPANAYRQTLEDLRGSANDSAVIDYENAIRQAAIVAGGGAGGARYGGRTGSRPMEEVLQDLRAAGAVGVDAPTTGPTDPALLADIEQLREVINEDLNAGQPPRLADLEELSQLLDRPVRALLEDFLRESATPVDPESLLTYLRRQVASGRAVDGSPYVDWLADMLGVSPQDALNRVMTPAGQEPEPEPEPVGPEPEPEYPVNRGGGWYLLSDGSRARGRANADQLQAELNRATAPRHPTGAGLTEAETDRIATWLGIDGSTDTVRLDQFGLVGTPPRLQMLVDNVSLETGGEDNRTMAMSHVVEVAWRDLYSPQRNVGWERLRELLLDPGAVSGYADDSALEFPDLDDADIDWGMTREPMAVEIDGRYFLIDGHHRALAMVLRNEPIVLRVVPVEQWYQGVIGGEAVVADWWAALAEWDAIQAEGAVPVEVARRFYGWEVNGLPRAVVDGLRNNEPGPWREWALGWLGDRWGFYPGEWVVMLRGEGASAPPTGTLGRVVGEVQPGVLAVDWNGSSAYNIARGDVVRRVRVAFVPTRAIQTEPDPSRFRGGLVLYIMPTATGDHNMVVYVED